MRCWTLPSACSPARRRTSRANRCGGAGRNWASRLPKKTSPKRGGRCGAAFRGKTYEPRLVVDTHAALWYLADDPALSVRAAAALDAITIAGLAIYLRGICLGWIIYLAR